MDDEYKAFLERKAITDPITGLSELPKLPDCLFPHQRDIVSWALRRGRAALFAGTGLGKSLMELAWADAIIKAHPGSMIILFAPLAVSSQMLREAEKFGISARLVVTQDECREGINITNYHKIEHFDLTRFIGVILDESSILKNESGHYRNKLVEASANIPFRLAATATPAPNDFMELGNHAEFLGVMKYTDMLATFFVHDGGETQKWRLKGHAENEFWKWMASWSVMLRKPSDLGYPNDGYDLPPLNYHMHTVKAIHDTSTADTLFAMHAQSLSERISARRNTINDRCAKAAEITPDDRHMVWWCNLNSEAELLEKLIPGAVNLHGGLKDDRKEEIIAGFLDGSIRVLISKPGICGFGLNFQHCADTGFVGLNDSWEQFYQAVRRFWRFGQDMPVNCHIIAADTEGATVANIQRKEEDADRMAASMVMHMADLSSVAVRGQVRDTPDYNPQEIVKLPEFLKEYENA